jgi:hypothetical protein
MSIITFDNDYSFRGSGISQGISRGLLVRRDGTDLLQEGLGLGVVALKRGGLTYFSPSCTTREGEGSMLREFAVDSAMVFRSPYLPLSGLMPLYGLGTKAYMSLPGYQDRLLGLRSRMFEWFDVRPVLRRGETLATATFLYLPGENLVRVCGSIRSLAGPLPTVYVMNELGAGHFDRSVLNGGEINHPPTGWCELPMTMPTPALLDPRRGTTFFIDRLNCCEGSGPRLFWGRERGDGLCWAGFEVELSNPGGLRSVDIEYEVRFGTVGE